MVSEMKVYAGMKPTVFSFIVITSIILVLVLTGIIVNIFASIQTSRIVLIILIFLVLTIGLSSLTAFELYRRRHFQTVEKNGKLATSEQPILSRQPTENGDGTYSSRNTLQV
ncbi:uncharacterized protein LOC123319314 isoform X2 [Coccinella septempunctata]|uniref:uncharacterized protein LOC123319314 isoform X2 n=1 Tax=Coccinella septempunctata TaxID=41139 RepID=UPI001D08C3DD|nr:uncharacterized protein LOC123319314 isoform X2 [Coccinella septempunctata]